MAGVKGRDSANLGDLDGFALCFGLSVASEQRFCMVLSRFYHVYAQYCTFTPIIPPKSLNVKVSTRCLPRVCSACSGDVPEKGHEGKCIEINGMGNGMAVCSIVPCI